MSRRNRKALKRYLGNLNFVGSRMAARIETGFRHCDRCSPHRGENRTVYKYARKNVKRERVLPLSVISAEYIAPEFEDFDLGFEVDFDDPTSLDNPDRLAELNHEFIEDLGYDVYFDECEWPYYLTFGEREMYAQEAAREGLADPKGYAERLDIMAQYADDFLHDDDAVWNRGGCPDYGYSYHQETVEERYPEMYDPDLQSEVMVEGKLVPLFKLPEFEETFEFEIMDSGRNTILVGGVDVYLDC